MMREPASSSRCSASQASRCCAVGRVTTARCRLARSSGPRRTSVWPSSRPTLSCSATSRVTRAFAVAVVARTGTPGGRASSSRRSRPGAARRGLACAPRPGRGSPSTGPAGGQRPVRPAPSGSPRPDRGVRARCRPWDPSYQEVPTVTPPGHHRDVAESWIEDDRPVRAFRCGAESQFDPDTWPATVPAIAQILRDGLELPTGLTVLVGENGSGKSTVVESLAEAFGLNPQGGSAQSRLFRTRDSGPGIGSNLLRQPRPLSRSHRAYFLRAARWDELDIVRHWSLFLREPDSYFRRLL